MRRLASQLLNSPWCLALPIALFASAWRLPNLRWGLPDIEEEALPMKKAFEMWGWDSGKLTLDPQTVGWPSFSFYVQLALQKLHYMIGRLSGDYENAYDYWLRYQLDPTQLAWLSRLSSVVLGVAVVAIACEGARRVVSWRAGIAAGLLLALSPLAIQYSQMITPDILVMFFAALGTLALLRLEARGSARDYVLAGLWTGLGAASKYTPVLLCVVIYVVHLRARHAAGLSLRWFGLNDRRLGYAALAALLAFCVASPYTFADLEILRRDFGYQAMHMSQGHFGQEQRAFGPGYYVQRVLVPALGWPALLVGLCGLVLLARHHWSPPLVFAVFFLGLGFLSTQFDRYMLPLLVPLALGLGEALRLLRRRLPQGWRREAVWLLALALVLFAPLQQSLAYHRQRAQPSTQQLAKQFILEQLPVEGTTLAMENYTVFLPYEQSEHWRQDPIFQRLSERQRHTLLDRDFYDYQVIPMYSARTQLSAYYYDLRHYVAYDWIVTSSSVRGRYQRQPQRFPEQNQFYRDLDEFCELIHQFQPGPHGRGPDIRFYRFQPDGAARLLSERGALAPNHWESYGERLHPPHFYSFVDLVALHALEEQRFDVAEYYYGVELATCTPEERPRVLGQLAYAKLRLTKWQGASRHYEELLRLTPDDPLALGNRAFAEWKLGNVDLARELFRRCIQFSRDESSAQWARERLAELEAGG